MLKYIVNQFDEQIRDVTLTITEWIEIRTLEEVHAEYAAHYDELVKQFPQARPPDEILNTPRVVEETIEVNRALHNDVIHVPWTAVLEQFPDLDPTRVSVGSGYDITCQGSIDTKTLNAEFAARGWRLIGGSAAADDTPAQRDVTPPSLTDANGEPLFRFRDRGNLLRPHFETH